MKRLGVPTARTKKTRFPGKLAGASLKPGWRRPGLIEGQGFPGKLAGASLKRLYAWQDEADRPAVSPANLPGPH